MNQLSTCLGTALAISLVAAGCTVLEPRPDPSRFYVLTSVDQGDDGPPVPNLSVGLGPILLPDYLQRQELVRRTGETEVRPSSVDRWAGTLDSNIKRVVMENLAHLLGSNRIAAYPSFEITRTDCSIDLTLVRFDLDPQNRAVLEARWEVRDNKDKGRIVSRDTKATYPASSTDTAAGVEALSLALGDLSRDLAAAVRQVSGKS